MESSPDTMRGKDMATTPNGHYDLLVIGAGAAGSAAADTALQQGARVALVERDKIGGTCLNYGCDPTKTLLHIANMLYQAHHVTGYGLHIPEASVQWEAVQSYVHKSSTRFAAAHPTRPAHRCERRVSRSFRAKPASPRRTRLQSAGALSTLTASSSPVAARRSFRQSKGWSRPALSPTYRLWRCQRCRAAWPSLAEVR